MTTRWLAFRSSGLNRLVAEDIQLKCLTAISIITALGLAPVAGADTHDARIAGVNATIDRADQRLYQAQRLTLLFAAATQLNHRIAKKTDECQRSVKARVANCYLDLTQFSTEIDQQTDALNAEKQQTKTLGLDSQFDLERVTGLLGNSKTRTLQSTVQIEKKIPTKIAKTPSFVPSSMCALLRADIGNGVNDARRAFRKSLAAGDLTGARQTVQSVKRTYTNFRSLIRTNEISYDNWGFIRPSNDPNSLCKDPASLFALVSLKTTLDDMRAVLDNEISSGHLHASGCQQLAAKKIPLANDFCKTTGWDQVVTEVLHAVNR